MNQPSPFPSFAAPFPGSPPAQFGGPPVFSANAAALPHGYGGQPPAPYGTAPRLASRRRRSSSMRSSCPRVRTSSTASATPR
jgi:hypothetical protein